MKMLFPRRRAAAVLCLLLPACAASPSGATGTVDVDKGYGAFLSALYAENQGDEQAAASYYAVALKSAPGNQKLLTAGFQAGLLAGAPEAVALAPSLPANALAVMLRGNQAALAGNYDQAKQLYAGLPQDDIAGLVKPLLLAWVEEGEGNEQAALTGLTGPDAGGGSFGALYVLNAALIADAAGDTAAAAPLYARIDASQPNLRIAQILASWEARQGHKDQAQAELQALMDAHPDLRFALPQLQAQMGQKVIATPAQGLAEAYLTLAGTLSDPQAATLRLVFLRFALELRPDLSAARLLLASTQTGADDPNATPTDAQLRAAVATLAPIAKDDPLYGPAAMREAAMLAQLGQTDQAMALLQAVLARQPGDASLLATMGDVLRNGGRNEEAVPYYTRAIAAAGQPVPQSAWTLYFDRGICEDEMGEWSAAEPDLKQAVAMAPDEPYALNYLAYSWALRGENLAQAHDMLARASALTPDDGAILDSLGYVELRQGQTASALAKLLRAVHLDPDDAEVNGHLGDAFFAAGQHLQAAYQWERALSLKPDEKLKAQLEADLARHFSAP